MKNLNTITGKNIEHILRETGCSDIFKINVKNIKKELDFCKASVEDMRKIDLVKEIVNIKQHSLEIDQSQMTTEELDEIILYLTTC